MCSSTGYRTRFNSRDVERKPGRAGLARVLCAVAAVLLLAAGASAAARAGKAADANAPVVATSGTAAAETSPTTIEAQVDLTDGCKLKFIAFPKDCSIRDGLRVLAAQCQKNIVPTQKVDGPLTVSRLYNVTFEQALDAMLGYGFKYEKSGDFIKVYSADEYKKIKEDPERMVCEIFTLYYISAAEAKKLITPVLSGAAQAKIETTSDAEKGLSSSGSSGASTGTSSTSGSSGSSGMGGSTSSGGGGNAPALHDTIVLYDFPENIARAKEILRVLDVRPKQVLVEATILSATLREGMDLGVDWNAALGTSLVGTSATQDYVSGDTVDRGTGATTPIQQIASGVTGTPLETAGFAQTATNGLRLGITSGNVTMFITALESVTDVTILANPKILAVNKQQGYVHVGKTLGFRGSTTIAQGGVATQGEVQFLDTGTVLVFRPYIGNDGYIRMDIAPQDSTAQLNVDKVPDKTTAEVTTNVVVKDGETIVIGGLFRDAVTTTRSQVPVLGNLPILGTLFRGTSDTSERQEVIVLITPHIICEPNQTNGDARAEDVRRKRAGGKDAMQFIDRSRLAEDAYARALKHYKDGDVEKAMYNVKLALIHRPTYLEALRLQERILNETDPEKFKKLSSIVIDATNKEEAPNWLRR